MVWRVDAELLKEGVVVPAKARLRVFPRNLGGRSKKTAEGGKLSAPKTYRLAPDLLEYVAEARAAGMSTTTLINDSLRLGRDVSDEMGPLWWEVEKLARVEAKPPGAVLAQLGREALRARTAAVLDAAVEKTKKR